MSVIQLFWLELLETIYLPIYNFYGYDSFITFIIITLFVSMQIWTFWHFFFKPFIYVCKLFVDVVRKNLLFKEVEVDEKTYKRVS